MNNTLEVVLLVCVAVLLWDRFAAGNRTASKTPVKQGSLDERIAQMIAEEGF